MKLEMSNVEMRPLLLFLKRVADLQEKRVPRAIALSKPGSAYLIDQLGVSRIQKVIIQEKFHIKFVYLRMNLVEKLHKKFLVKIVYGPKRMQKIILAGTSVCKIGASQHQLYVQGRGHMEVFSHFQHVEIPAEIFPQGDSQKSALPLLGIKSHSQRGLIIPEIRLVEKVILGFKFLGMNDRNRKFALELDDQTLIDLPAPQLLVHPPESVVIRIVSERYQVSFISQKRDTQPGIQFSPVIILYVPDFIHIISEILL